MGAFDIGEKIDLFDAKTWEPGALERVLVAPSNETPRAGQSGTFQADYHADKIAGYRETLVGKPVAKYDPNDFFKKTLGLSQPTPAGRTNIDMLRAFRLSHGYRPEPKYLPLPHWLAPAVQKTCLALNRVSPAAVDAVDRLATRLIVRKQEQADTLDPNPYGKLEDIIRGEKSALTVSERYFGALQKEPKQFAWGPGVHTGSIAPDRDANEHFGTYEIALASGFTEEQARRIAIECNRVDTNETHYRDPYDPQKRRLTGTSGGGKNGDYHWHFNRSPEGVEDTRITASKVHLARAVQLAGEGYFDAAERELGIGLHSLQDMFAHAQITPVNHALLGSFPDFVRYNPVGMFDTALATQAYLEEFLRQVAPSPSAGREALDDGFPATGALVAGDASPEAKAAVGEALSRYPKALVEFLERHGVHIHVGAPGTKLTALGFGEDLDGDGIITPGRWVDVNQDGVMQPYEVEDELPDGRKWDEQAAAYDHEQRLIFLSAGACADSTKLDSLLRHEIRHALDELFGDDPALHARWTAYVTNLFAAARARGEIDFAGLDPHEYFAHQ